MKTPGDFNVKRVVTGSTFVLIGTGVALLSLTALPFYKAKQEPQIAETYAQTVVQDLQNQLNGPQAKVLDLDSPAAMALTAISRNLIERNLFARFNDVVPQVSGEQSPQQLETLEAVLAKSRKSSRIETPPPAVGPLLSGIFIDGESAQAVIDDTVVTRGDVVRGYRIVGIFRESVLLSKGDVLVELRLKGK